MGREKLRKTVDNYESIINQKTVIICSAGSGKRLGLNIPKALLDIDGKPFIIRQLETLTMATDIRVVVGFKADEVVAAIRNCRDDITIVYNNDYENTNVAYSFSLALDNPREYITYIDGDLFVNPIDMASLLLSEDEYICAVPISSEKPMKIDTFLSNGIMFVSDFSYDNGQYEWAGAMNIRSNKIHLNGNKDFICDLLRPLLPLPVKMINAKEVDTIGDYKKFIDWFIKEKSIIYNSRIYEKNVNINKEKIKSFWNQRALKYTKEYPYMTVKFGDNKPGYAEEWDVYEKIHTISRLGISPEDYVLDIGCGIGRLAEVIIPKCKYYVGTDFAENLISIANDRMSTLFSQDKYKFVIENVLNVKKENIDIPYSGKYSIVLLAGILMYINDTDIKYFLDNLLCLVSKKCTIYFSGPTAKNSRLTLNEFYSDELKQDYSAIYRTENEYYKLFKILFDNDFLLTERDDYNMFSAKTSETERVYMILRRD